ncbi:MAG TPA: M50 family metallopeptidase [Candidatus Baltobacteraceae bacterium]|nr:M50 family metallopeptidase [Candidatus Baltobacteraceae bacterium]
MSLDRIAVFLLMLSVLVVLHEYGHFIVARLNGVKVTDFAVGFGTTILKWTSKRSGTTYRLNALPLGGYCQMKGEDGTSNEAEQQREFRSGAYEPDNFQAKSALRRLAIIVAGPAMNFVLALVLLFGVACAFGTPDPHPTTVVGPVIAGGPADRAGLRAGDRITKINGVAMRSGEQLIAKIYASAGKTLHITFVRDGQTRAVTAVPKLEKVNGKAQGHLDFHPSFPPPTGRGNVIGAASLAWTQFSEIITQTLGALGGLFTHPAQAVGNFSGPIGMARVSNEVEGLGLGPYLSFAALISCALGIFNLLPIPALDGGRGVFILVEMLRGRPVDPEKEALVHVGGFAVLIVLMLAVSFHDVTAAISGQGPF